MRVVYDISVLGRGCLDSRSRTGIFRSVESLLIALYNSDQIDLTVTALTSKQHQWDSILAKEYIRSQPFSLEAIFQSAYQSQFNLDSLYDKLRLFQKGIIEKSNYQNIVLYRFNRLIKYLAFSITSWDYRCTFEPSKYQVFHSPFFRLPAVDKTRSLSRIITIHDLIPLLYPNFVTLKNKSLFREILSSINPGKDWVICNSSSTKNDFCDYSKISTDRVFVTPFAADKFFFRVSDRDLIKLVMDKYQISHAPYLLSICTLEPRKNLAFLVSCFNQLLHEEPNLDINLVLVGAVGWSNEQLFEKLAASEVLRSRVIFTGYVPDDELSALYTGATAFLFPSLYEGFGLPPLEAMQCGVPVITSNTSSLPEVVGDAGIMIDPTDEDALCQAILNLVNNEQLRAELSQKGLERAKQFSWAKCAEQTVEVYRIAAENPP
ncbi:MAG TPA: glycosyltransferase family 4 protein [Leptolyngbyaceae cyanobacterium M65_K2018_010]|nr:glycosyltransferase family 4 protein [Leptolyngbyaceae cyanobacterium M65_K2018_010]